MFDLFHIKIKMRGYRWTLLEGLSMGLLSHPLTVHWKLPASPPPPAGPPQPLCHLLVPVAPLVPTHWVCSPQTLFILQVPSLRWASRVVAELWMGQKTPRRLFTSWHGPHSIPEEGKRRVYKIILWDPTSKDFPAELCLDTELLPSEHGWRNTLKPGTEPDTRSRANSAAYSSTTLSNHGTPVIPVLPFQMGLIPNLFTS